MALYSKGVETKNAILAAARQLFYEKGYNETSVRELAALSEVNLGLIKYYFSSKSEIAKQLYIIIRKELNNLTRINGIDGDDCFSFLFRNLTELIYSLQNKSFGRFFVEIMREPVVEQFYQERIITSLKLYIKRPIVEEDYYMLTCVSIAAMKPALVNWNTNEDGNIDTLNVVQYYLEQYIHFLGESNVLYHQVLSKLNQFHFDVGARFTPILVPLEGRQLTKIQENNFIDEENRDASNSFWKQR